MNQREGRKLEMGSPRLSVREKTKSLPSHQPSTKLGPVSCLWDLYPFAMFGCKCWECWEVMPPFEKGEEGADTESIEMHSSAFGCLPCAWCYLPLGKVASVVKVTCSYEMQPSCSHGKQNTPVDQKYHLRLKIASRTLTTTGVFHSCSSSLTTLKR